MLQSWLWDYELITKVTDHADYIPAHVLDAMRNDPNLLVDSDDLTRDGFEAHIGEENVLVRASVHNAVVTYHPPP